MGRIIYFSAKRKRFHTHTSSVECVVCIALHCRREFSCRNSNWTELRRWKSWSRQWHACAGMSTERRCKRKHSERRQRWRRRRQAPQYACEAHTKKMLDRKQKSRDETQPRARSARKLQKWLNPIFMSTLNTIYENCFLQFLSFRFAFLFKRFKREYLNFLLVSQSSTSSTSCSYRGLVARARPRSTFVWMLKSAYVNHVCGAVKVLVSVCYRHLQREYFVLWYSDEMK